jgi:hypothetical protein
MRNPMLPGVVLFYSVLALILAVIMVLVHESALMGARAQGFSNACENLALIAIAVGVWVQRR